MIQLDALTLNNLIEFCLGNNPSQRMLLDLPEYLKKPWYQFDRAEHREFDAKLEVLTSVLLNEDQFNLAMLGQIESALEFFGDRLESKSRAFIWMLIFVRVAANPIEDCTQIYETVKDRCKDLGIDGSNALRVLSILFNDKSLLDNIDSEMELSDIDLIEQMGLLEFFNGNDAHFRLRRLAIKARNAEDWATESYYCNQLKELDDSDAIFRLAQMHEQGLGGKINFEQALMLYQRASELGQPEADEKVRQILKLIEITASHSAEVDRREMKRIKWEERREHTGEVLGDFLKFHTAELVSREFRRLEWEGRRALVEAVLNEFLPRQAAEVARREQESGPEQDEVETTELRKQAEMALNEFLPRQAAEVARREQERVERIERRDQANIVLNEFLPRHAAEVARREQERVEKIQCRDQAQRALNEFLPLHEQRVAQLIKDSKLEKANAVLSKFLKSHVAKVHRDEDWRFKNIQLLDRFFSQKFDGRSPETKRAPDFIAYRLLTGQLIDGTPIDPISYEPLFPVDVPLFSSEVLECKHLDENPLRALPPTYDVYTKHTIDDFVSEADRRGMALINPMTRTDITQSDIVELESPVWESEVLLWLNRIRGLKKFAEYEFIKPDWFGANLDWLSTIPPEFLLTSKRALLLHGQSERLKIFNVTAYSDILDVLKEVYIQRYGDQLSLFQRKASLLCDDLNKSIDFSDRSFTEVSREIISLQRRVSLLELDVQEYIDSLLTPELFDLVNRIRVRSQELNQMRASVAHVITENAVSHFADCRSSFSQVRERMYQLVYADLRGVDVAAMKDDPRVKMLLEAKSPLGEACHFFGEYHSLLTDYHAAQEQFKKRLGSSDLRDFDFEIFENDDELLITHIETFRNIVLPDRYTSASIIRAINLLGGFLSGHLERAPIDYSRFDFLKPSHLEKVILGYNRRTNLLRVLNNLVPMLTVDVYNAMNLGLGIPVFSLRDFHAIFANYQKRMQHEIRIGYDLFDPKSVTENTKNICQRIDRVKSSSDLIHTVVALSQIVPDDFMTRISNLKRICIHNTFYEALDAYISLAQNIDTELSSAWSKLLTNLVRFDNHLISICRSLESVSRNDFRSIWFVLEDFKSQWPNISDRFGILYSDPDKILSSKVSERIKIIYGNYRDNSLFLFDKLKKMHQELKDHFNLHNERYFTKYKMQLLNIAARLDTPDNLFATPSVETCRNVQRLLEASSINLQLAKDEFIKSQGKFDITMVSDELWRDVEVWENNVSNSLQGLHDRLRNEINVHRNHVSDFVKMVSSKIDLMNILISGLDETSSSRVRAFIKGLYDRIGKVNLDPVLVEEESFLLQIEVLQEPQVESIFQQISTVSSIVCQRLTSQQKMLHEELIMSEDNHWVVFLTEFHQLGEFIKSFQESFRNVPDCIAEISPYIEIERLILDESYQHEFANFIAFAHGELESDLSRIEQEMQGPMVTHFFAQPAGAILINIEAFEERLNDMIEMFKLKFENFKMIIDQFDSSDEPRRSLDQFHSRFEAISSHLSRITNTLMVSRSYLAAWNGVILDEIANALFKISHPLDDNLMHALRELPPYLITNAAFIHLLNQITDLTSADSTIFNEFIFHLKIEKPSIPKIETLLTLEGDQSLENVLVQLKIVCGVDKPYRMRSEERAKVMAEERAMDRFANSI